MPKPVAPLDRRVVYISILAIGLALVTTLVAQVLIGLIGLVTNLAFHGRFSTTFASPLGHTLGAWVMAIPVAGGLVVGLMARYGAPAIRGHGIPEAMEQILTNESRIPLRMTFMKPLSAAVAIGTGGPFGAEGPIIATGGALGSLLGQVLHVSAAERKTLLAAGAAAGMAAIFDTPIAAVVLAVELLLFEFRPRSLIPVALAVATATALREAILGAAPVFAMPEVTAARPAALAAYLAIGAVIGLASVGVTRLVYAVEDAFHRLPMHWMWWPAIGGVAVGVVGYFEPRTLGVGYENIEAALGGHMAASALLALCAAKFVSWVIALGSGTSGGTLAPLFTVGGALGGAIGIGLAALLPAAGIDPGLAALVGMAAMFAGASRAVLASVIFAFETTHQTAALLPLLGGCAAAYLVSCLAMRTTIMTEKIVRRGVRVPAEYSADLLDQITAGSACTKDPVCLRAEDAIDALRTWMSWPGAANAHQGYPVVDSAGRLRGVVTRRDVYDVRHPEGLPLNDILQRPPIVVESTHSLREAVEHMLQENVGRLVVVAPGTGELVGILTRSDILAAEARRIGERLRGPRKPVFARF